MQMPFTVLDESARYSLNSVAQLYRQLLPKMTYFAECTKIRESVFVDDDQFKVIPSDRPDHVELSYIGTRIRLTLIVGLQGKDAAGKIICTHVFDGFGKDQYLQLGEFSVDERGRTNFGERSGKPFYVHEAADLIIASYFKEALESNLQIKSDSVFDEHRPPIGL